MQYAPTRVRAKFNGFHIPAPEYTKNAPDFTLPDKDTPKTHPISPIPIGIHPKPARFYTQTFAAGHFGAYAFAPYTNT